MRHTKERKSYSKDNPPLTNTRNVGYNEKESSRCNCGRVIAFRKDNKIYVKCKDCKRWIAVFDVEKVQ